MQLGMIGLGRMGANLVRRLLRAGHACVVYDRNPQAVRALAGEGATAADSLEALAAALAPPRAVWLMLPAAAVDETLRELVAHLQPEDVVIDGGNSHYLDDLRRSQELGPSGLRYVDVGTSGGIWGLQRGYCLMIGGDEATVRHLEPIFKAIAPGRDAAPPTPGRERAPAAGRSTAEEGYLHCGPSGAGHFVKMVHNAIEYGLMAAYAEGLNILHRADVGLRGRPADAETAPLRHPEAYRYTFDLAEIAEVWRRGSVVASWLLDLTAAALHEDPQLSRFTGYVADSGEGRWTVSAAIDEGVPVPVLGTALFQRFASQGHDRFAEQLLSALRYQFGGHVERPAGG
ncbi:MAG TPA: decarboxylating 6-phosphogluconate dehydrogenase [Chloroflexota bacterium]|nr:decarboxylating 6-phosphogluconate dehydrogenase [Chloroflexota bacterium]